MKIMERKQYNRPEVKNTKIDYSITMTLGSQDPVSPPGAPTDPNGENPVVNGFMNPFNWFK